MKRFLLSIAPLASAMIAIASALPVTAQATSISQENQLEVIHRSVSSRNINQSEKQLVINRSSAILQRVEPALVRVVNGCQGEVTYDENGQSYRVRTASFGTGFFVSSTGTILTNAHVVELASHEDKCTGFLFQDFVEQLAAENDAVALRAMQGDYKAIDHLLETSHLRNFEVFQTAILSDDRELPYTVQATGEPIGKGQDIAVIQVDISNAPMLRFANSDRVQALDQITAAGFPGVIDVLQSVGILTQVEPSFTSGEVSARQSTADGDLLQITAITAPGNSGGPLLNDRGEVIGIITWSSTRDARYAFAIPSNIIMDFIEQNNITNAETIVLR